MCGHISIRFIDFMLKGKGFLDYTNLFLSMIMRKMIEKMKKIYCVICGKYRKFANPKLYYLLEKNISSFYHL